MHLHTHTPPLTLSCPSSPFLSPLPPSQIDEDENALRFYQVWHILPEGDAYWVHNDIFRLAISM